MDRPDFVHCPECRHTKGMCKDMHHCLKPKDDELKSNLPSRERRVKHGLGGTPTYRSWYTMLKRCTDPSDIGWDRYGGRGISVCDEWLNIEQFVADMGLRPEGKTIDRINSDGNYEPGNCRWATELEQQRNRAFVKCTEASVAEIRAAVASGEMQKDVAARFGIAPSNVCRIVSGEAWKDDCAQQK